MMHFYSSIFLPAISLLIPKQCVACGIGIAGGKSARGDQTLLCPLCHSLLWKGRDLFFYGPTSQQQLRGAITPLATGIVEDNHSLTQSPDSLMFCLWPYEPTQQRVIHEAKFGPNREALRYLGSALGQALTPYFLQRRWELVIPVPPSEVHSRKRLLNHTLQISRALAATLHADSLAAPPLIAHSVLQRNQSLPPQSSLSSTARRAQGKKMFQPTAHTSCVTDRRILLIDDVLTTGTTVMNARAILEQYNPTLVDIATIAATHALNA
jgi:predicted amidophosphoribosyltransferase